LRLLWRNSLGKNGLRNFYVIIQLKE
jgi:hypothetical protein